MQGQHIQVFARCRPPTTQEKRSVVEVSEDTNEIIITSFSNEGRPFLLDQVFGSEAKQRDVYQSIVAPLIDEVLLGFNCTVLAYGQTGTGKTYTMEGERSNHDLSWEDDPCCGMIPRAISQLFDHLKRMNSEFTVRVSFLELYNEDTYDLLSAIDDTTKLKIFDDIRRKGSVIVGGLQERIVHTKEEIFDILRQGSSKRMTAATLLNACSSRSHTVFCITVHLREATSEGEERLRIGKLNLVDLAGSENIGRSGAQDRRAREAVSINQSLLALGRVITALVEKRPHIPYRESKLTRLLQDSLGGRTKTSIVATISPAVEDLEDTINTLEYASRAKKVTNKPEMNQHLTKKALLRGYVEDCPTSSLLSIQALIDKHSMEMCELEYKVRNEVAQEFKREIEKMKKSFEEQYEQETSALKRDLKVVNQLAEYRASLLSEVESKLKEREIEIQSKLTELEAAQLTIKQLESRVIESDASPTEPSLNDKKKATRVRKTAVLEESGDYANLTFDDADEIIQVSAKKSRKKVVCCGGRKKAINHAITLSGKKRKFQLDEEETAELSPLPTNTRVTRSRTTKRKLAY